MIRIATPEDLPTIVAIYNQAIEARFQTAFMERLTVDERTGWFEDHTPEKYPLFVYEADDTVVGWLSVSPYRSGRAALRYTVELSYFIDPAYHKRGIGTQLLMHAINSCRQMNYKTLLAIILDKNTASIALMNKFGFEQWAFLPGVADYDGVECSHLYYGMKL